VCDDVFMHQNRALSDETIDKIGRSEVVSMIMMNWKVGGRGCNA